MKQTKSTAANNVTRLRATPSTPSELDAQLYRRIQNYVTENSWRQLASEVKRYVNDQYKSAYGLVADGTISPEDLEKEIKSQIPSRTYIEDYVNGRPICYRYTNTLANFFNQHYVLKNHNPCTEFLVKLNTQH